MPNFVNLSGTVFGANGEALHTFAEPQGKCSGLRLEADACYHIQNPKTLEHLTGVKAEIICSVSTSAQLPPPPICRCRNVVHCRVMCDSPIACAAPNVERQRACAQEFVRHSQPLFSVLNDPHLPFCFVVSLIWCADNFSKKNSEKIFGGIIRLWQMMKILSSQCSIYRAASSMRCGLTKSSHYLLQTIRSTGRLTKFRLQLIGSRNILSEILRNLTRLSTSHLSTISQISWSK